MRSPGVITRIVLVVVAIVIGKFLWPHVAPLSDRALFWMGIAAEGVLAAYLVAIVVAMLGPWWRGGDQAVGRGCAAFIAAGFVAAGAVLGAGLAMHIRWLITPIAGFVLFTAVLVIGGLIAEGIKARR